MVEHQPSKLDTWVRFPSPALSFRNLEKSWFLFFLHFWFLNFLEKLHTFPISSILYLCYHLFIVNITFKNLSSTVIAAHYNERICFISMEKIPSIKEMPPKARAQYIWDYYKLPIIGGICVIAFVISMIYHYATYKESALDIIMVNSVNPESADIVTATSDFFEAEGFSADKEEITLDTSITFAEDMGDSNNYYSNQALTVKFAAGGGDVLFGPEFALSNYAASGAMMPLTDILTKDQLAQYADLLVYTTDEDTNEEYAYGIKLTDNQWLLDNHYYYEGETPVMTVGYHAHAPETAKDFFRYVLTFQD